MFADVVTYGHVEIASPSGLTHRPRGENTDGPDADHGVVDARQASIQLTFEAHGFHVPKLCPALTRHRYRLGLVIISFGCALLVTIFTLARLSSGWLSLSCVMLVFLAQDTFWMHQRMRRVIFIVLIAALAIYVLLCFARLCVAATPHVVTEFVGVMILLLCIIPHVFVWQKPQASEEGCCSRPWKICSTCCEYIAAGVVAVLAALTVLDASWGICAIVAIGPESWAHVKDGPRLNYWCEGVMRNNAIIVLQPGWSGQAPTYYWYMKGLRSWTRTCTFDSAGMGWSSLQGNYGFRDDAEGIQAVFAAEFGKAGLGSVGAERIAIVGGHSRGWVVASSFENTYVAQYSKIVLLNLDGSACAPFPEWPVGDPSKEIFLIVLSLGVPLSGLARLALLSSASLRNSLLSAGEVDWGLEYTPDIHDTWPVFERSLGLSLGGWLQSSVDRMEAWIENYDGPTRHQCACCSPGLVVMAPDVCPATTSGRRVCAGHVSIIVSSYFANNVVAALLVYLNKTINTSRN